MNARPLCRAALWCAALAGLIGPTTTAHGQARASGAGWPIPTDVANATTGSADEESLLLAQLLGRAPSYPTGVRSFSMTMLDTLASGIADSTHRRKRLALMTPIVSLRYNSSRASDTSGVVWSGRGVTIAGMAGGIANIGPFAFALRPVAFWTQNRAFAPMLDRPGLPPFADPVTPYGIDLPYRFGDHSYARFDPGESFAQFDTRWLVAGVSTATQSWGPMHVYPLLLGTEAGGFPHVFLGSGLPWNVGIGTLTARMAVGRLDRSAFSPIDTGDSRRLASELIAVFSPRMFTGLEIGAARFFHRRWPSDGVGLSVLSIPFEGFLKEHLAGKDGPNAVPDNQLAGVFIRVAPPKAGFEMYGELVRDDHNWDTVDFMGEPDHDSAYGLGIRRAWANDATGQISALTLEMVNGRISQLDRVRSEASLYQHGQIREGHTEHGKLLASPMGRGYGYHADYLRRRSGGGWRATLALESTAQAGEGGTWYGTPVGQYRGEFARILATNRGEYTAQLRWERGWNALSGGTNVGIYLTYRPTFLK